MPKKGPGAAGSKKAPPSASNDEGSYIVFGNDKPGKRKTTNVQQAQDLTKADSDPSQDAAKKPDTRKLVGGASWTGKLPVNMLSEHCQKQKWEKPEYTMVRGMTGGEFIVHSG